MLVSFAFLHACMYVYSIHVWCHLHYFVGHYIDHCASYQSCTFFCVTNIGVIVILLCFHSEKHLQWISRWQFIHGVFFVECGTFHLNSSGAFIAWVIFRYWAVWTFATAVAPFEAVKQDKTAIFFEDLIFVIHRDEFALEGSNAIDFILWSIFHSSFCGFVAKVFFFINFLIMFLLFS